jgi:soluble lytic murein transglycosylase
MSAVKIVRRLVLGWCWVLGMSASQLSAQPIAKEVDTQLASHRFHYQKAKAALAQNNTQLYREHLEKLGNYPLRQYLEFSELRNRFASVKQEDIDSFLARHPDSFLASRLRSNYLQFLASRQKWADFNRYYVADDNNPIDLQCQSLLARIKTGDTSAYAEVAPFWDIGKSQADACEPLFTQWRSAGYLTQDLVWSRFNKAMHNGETRFAQHLSNQLTTYKSQAALYLQVHANPKLITQRQRFQKQDLQTQHTIAYGIKKLSAKAPLDALYNWQMYEAQQLFPEDVMQDTKLDIVKRLVRNGHSAEAQSLVSYSHMLRHEEVLDELLREALADNDWPRVADGLLLLGAESRTQDRWRYWAARAQEVLDRPIAGFAEPERIYRSLAQNRSFYGFLSADKLRQTYALVDESTALDKAFLEGVANLPAMQRSYELWLTGNLTESRAEWLHASRAMDDRQLAAAGQLAQDWGWYSTGIQTMINGNLWNQLTVRFPLAYQDEITRLANATQLESTFIYAIARQESAFDAGARSPVGATGLMQLMPQTAAFMAKKSGIQHSGKADLLQPEHNMRLGSQYLSHLMQSFNGNRILAAAAYNAGPHRVNRWLSEQGKEKPVDVWIETIPFKETRNYVQNVLCFSVIYAYRMGQPTLFLSETEAKQSL